MAEKDLRVRDEETPGSRVLPFVLLYTGIFLLGVASVGSGTLASAGWLHRGIQVGVGAVLAVFGLFLYWRAHQKRNNERADRP
jgi:hypothetical protein